MVKYYIDGVFTMTQMYWGHSTFFVFYFILLMYAMCHKRKNKNLGFIARYSGIMLFIIYNPLTFLVTSIWLSGGIYHFQKYVENGMLNSVRLFYVLPISITMAYVLTQYVSEINNIWKKRGLVLLICILIMLLGENIYTKGNYTIAENLYKIPAEVIEVSDVLEDCVQGEEKCKVLVSNDLVEYIRQYNSNVYMPYGREAINIEFAKDFSNGLVDEDVLMNFLEEEKCNYIISNLYPHIKMILESNGYELVGQTEQHFIFRLQE